MARRRPTEPTANPARGAILVAVAVVVGLVLLRHGLDTSETIIPSTTDGASTDSTDSSTDGTSVDDGTDGTDGSTTARQPSEVPTIVLNGSGIQGAAGRYSTALATLGYNLTDADGANSTSNVTATQVLYAARLRAGGPGRGLGHRRTGVDGRADDDHGARHDLGRAGRRRARPRPRRPGAAGRGRRRADDRVISPSG